jgi:hypothetical protein
MWVISEQYVYKKSRDAEPVAEQEQMSESVGALIKTPLQVEETYPRLSRRNFEPFLRSFHLTYADLPGLSSEAVVATLTEYVCNLLKVQGYTCIEFYA